MIESPKILCNQIRTPDGTILESNNRHDYKTYVDTISKELYIVDGGLDYLRRNTHKVPYMELSVYENDDFDLVRENFKWGTYGKNGDDEIHYIILKDMTSEHINAILTTQHLSDTILRVFETELLYRDNTNEA